MKVSIIFKVGAF